MSFGGPPVTTQTIEEADELMRNEEKESAIGNISFEPIWYLLNLA